MLAKNILDYEKQFDENGVDAFGVKHIKHSFQEEIPDTNNTIDLIKLERLDSDKSGMHIRKIR